MGGLFQIGKPPVVQNCSVKDIKHFVASAEEFRVMFNILRRRKLEERGKKRD